jgi:Fe-Mn family superoxide dismutase
MPDRLAINRNMKDPINTFKNIILEAESKREQLEQTKLTISLKDLSPIMSEETLKYHFGKLAKAYVDRYNSKEGDDDFNYGGAKLHNIFFPQLMPVKSSNKPSGSSKKLIDSKWGDFEKFKEEFSKTAMSVQGSGWIYMDSSGNLKVIKNHEYKKSMDIMLLIDWWEHAWALDYQHDKAKYLKNIWKIIDWEVINNRLDVNSK